MVSFILLSILLTLQFSPSTPQVLPLADPGGGGEWRLLQENIGISAMHMQLMINDKVVMFDRTDFGASNLSLPGGRCRYDPQDPVLPIDCTAHSVLYDIWTNSFRPLMVQTNTWCSSGSVLPDGTLVQTGGYNDGDHVIRTLTPCGGEGTCDWVEFPASLAERRWYATNQILPDGRIIIVGGRGQLNYEFYPRNPETPDAIYLPFLEETRDFDENNLYPFIHLLPDGSLFMFANKRSIAFDYTQNHVIREYPIIPGNNPRNYPSTGSSVLLPIDENINPMQAEVLICGGASSPAYRAALRGTFVHATATCLRMTVTDPNPQWITEYMPMPRVMSDMLLLPDGTTIVINGGGAGTAGWELGRDPVTTPVIYNPTRELNNRFQTMIDSPRPRMYHSSAIVLPDGRVLVGGGNPHAYYNFTGVLYPTDISLESFAPPYLSPRHDSLRPKITEVAPVIGYNMPISLKFEVQRFKSADKVSVRLLAPSFTTHSYSMNQRMVVLRRGQVWETGPNSHGVDVTGPSTREVAPPGYYLLFVVHGSVPSTGKWVKLQ